MFWLKGIFKLQEIWLYWQQFLVEIWSILYSNYLDSSKYFVHLPNICSYLHSEKRIAGSWHTGREGLQFFLSWEKKLSSFILWYKILMFTRYNYVYYILWFQVPVKLKGIWSYWQQYLAYSYLTTCWTTYLLSPFRTQKWSNCCGYKMNTLKTFNILQNE